MFDDEAAGIATSGAVTIVEGSSFAICDRSGDIGTNPIDGVVVGDTRILSRLVLTVDGERVEPLATDQPSHASVLIVGRIRRRRLLVRRFLEVGDGLRSVISLTNLTHEAVTLTIVLTAASDLADVFAVKEGRATARPREPRAVSGSLEFSPSNRARGAILRPSPAAAVDTAGAITWHVDLEPSSTWTSSVDVIAIRGGAAVQPRTGLNQRPPLWARPLPVIESDVPGLAAATQVASRDLNALRLLDDEHPDDVVVAAGAPWFMTLFGRDSILASWMALLLDPTLALATVRTLARLQGRRSVAETEEQPGRILHEIRFGETPSLALSAGSVYYGTVDATPLFVMLVGELHRWGVPWSDLQPLLPAVDSALGWLSGAGDPDDDGYVEHLSTTATGLANQGWKDSWDSVAFSDGHLAGAPIALAEVQAYAYAAWLAGAELSQAAGRPHEAASRRAQAATLRAAFNRDFWLDDIGAIALALDGDKRPVDAISSNMGHCLWTGIVDPAHIDAVAGWLSGPQLSSGWGVRTLGKDMARFDPLSYHNGSVWPHDTALCIAGLRRVGCVDEALRLANALLGAAHALGGRLPELFSGLGPGDIAVPVPYPASCSPQAWASAAPLLLLRALLGLEPDLPSGTVGLDPALPEGSTHLSVQGLRLGPGLVDIEIDGDTVTVQGLPTQTRLVRGP